MGFGFSPPAPWLSSSVSSQDLLPSGSMGLAPGQSQIAWQACVGPEPQGRGPTVSGTSPVLSTIWASLVASRLSMSKASEGLS